MRCPKKLRISAFGEGGRQLKEKVLGKQDRLFYGVVNGVMTLLLLAVVYPLIYMLSASFSSPWAVSTGRVVLWPVEPTLRGYAAVFSYKPVFIGYRNTLFYTAVGTALNVAVTLMAAYPLARRDLVGRGILMKLFTFTMVFSGGMIPTYLLVGALGLVNTVWSQLIPGMISVYNMIIARTFISEIPGELLEAAKIDGCSDLRFFMEMVIPLSKAVIAVLALYYAVSHWNTYFKAFLYLSNQQLFPLQLFLRQILVMNSVDSDLLMDPEMQEAIQGMRELLKYALIVVSTVPILCVYPFVQRYFIKGVMIGSVKG